MNKRTLNIILIALITAISLSAQSFNFEETEVPTSWTAIGGGTLQLSTQHYKEGSQSLSWETTGASVVTVQFPAFTASTGNSAYLQIYSPTITNDTLVVEFLNNANVRRTAHYLLNYKGWREFNRAYTEYLSNISFSVTSVRFTLKPTSDEQRRLCFDQVRFNQSTPANRIIGSQWILDKQYFSNSIQLNHFANPIDLPTTTPTEAELQALQQLRTSHQRTPAQGNATNLNLAKNFALEQNIVRNTDGTVTGNAMDMSITALTTAVVTDYVTKLEILAAGGLTDSATLVLFHDLLDHLIDQGFGEGVSFLIRTNDYTASRTIPSKLLNLLPVCNSAQQAEILKLVRWISYFGLVYEPADRYQESLNSDVIYLYLPHMLGATIFQQDDAVAVRDLKAFVRFLERNTEYVPGGKDILKPDGTGFHHNTHYNNYMYAYQPWAEYIYQLNGTPFRISRPAYERFKKAIIAIYTMATLDSNNTRHYANSLSGRNPFGPGIQVFFSRTLFENLIEAGGDILGTTIDEELAGAYNYFFETNKYEVAPASYEGFHQFNYSPLGIFRRKNWVATMRAPTTRLWGAEIYSKENRFGRYQSHGTLEITYKGTAATSGYPGSSNGGGWDWNVVPGTTTVHYTNWQDMMPNRNTTDRFDQYTKTKDFSGALAWGNTGIFATDFDQGDNWGSQRFTPTNLVFKKSMYAFDFLIISLGSTISAPGIYSNTMITATNLFQNLTSSVSGPLIVNGEEIARPNSLALPGGTNNWIVTPQGTGYLIPSSNHDTLHIIHDIQKTPYETGSDYANPVTAAAAAKAYINHGVKPTNKNYTFVVVPSTNSAAMAALAVQMADDGGSLFTIHEQSATLHALTYIPTQTTAYTFFEASSEHNFGIVTSASGQHLLIHQSDSITGRQHFAASNPNLQPINDAIYGWRSTPTEVTLTLQGEWLPLHPTAGVEFHAPSAGETEITLTFTDGEPLYFSLKHPDDTSIDITTSSPWITYSQHASTLTLTLSEPINEPTTIRLYTTLGKQIRRDTLEPGSDHYTLSLSDYEKGTYLCRIENSKHKTTLKIIL
jgi:chondroitin-sulfate-ABC endolyase/exolyase